MSLPRQILPGATYLITRRCTQRQFLLKPTALTCEIFKYCLAAAALRTGVCLHALVVLSNHWHSVLTDERGLLPEFLAYLHKYVSKAVNASLGRWENLFASESTSVVKLENDEDILDKIAYTVANPVSSGLVSHGDKWPGLRAYRPGKCRVRKPNVFFRPNGPMPNHVDLEITLPPLQSIPRKTALKTIEQRVADREKECRAKFASSGHTFLGARAVLRQNVYDSPGSSEPRRNLSPRVAAKNKWARIEALRRIKTFVDEHRRAYQAWKAGFRDVVFPPGTYSMRVRHGVRCAPS